jgi:hypothetical protein
LKQSGTVGRNALGFDQVNNRLIYGNNADNDWQVISTNVTFAGSVSTVSTTNTQISTNIKTPFGATWPGGVANTNFDMSGGGTFYNGRYYFIPDDATVGGSGSPANLLSVAIDASGTISDPKSQLLGQSLGNFGDIALSGNTMYFVSDLGFGKVTLPTTSSSTVAAAVTFLSTTVTNGQLAFDSDGKLWNNRTANGSLAELNITNGSITQTKTLTGTIPAQFSDFAGYYVVPETSTSLLSLIGLTAITLRRRRS